MAALASAIASTTPETLDAKSGFDAIVVGGGAAGGFATSLLAEAGMEVLALDAAWPTRFWRSPIRSLTSHAIPIFADERLLGVLPTSISTLGMRALRLAGRLRQPIQAKCFAWLSGPDAFVDDRDFPYQTEKDTRFDWFRANQLGGRMVIAGHGRQYYRFGPRDLAADVGDGGGWPVTSDELTPWYDFVEDRLGLVAGAEGSPALPDCRPAEIIEPAAHERELMERVRMRWPDAGPILGRYAPPRPNLEIAAQTGRVMCRPGAVVNGVRVSDDGRAEGVTWFDRATGTTREARAPVVFLCASALESTRILMMSRSARRPDGLGSGSNALGRFLMDHVLLSAQGVGGGLPDEPIKREDGRCVYIPRIETGASGEQGAFSAQLYRWSTAPGRSYLTAVTFGEMRPWSENRVVLSDERRDAFGSPVLKIACRHTDAEHAVARAQASVLRELAALADVKVTRIDEQAAPPGSAIHECGSARMGSSPDTSVLDPNNECWDAKGLYVTDGAAFASQGAQNPTLTILALTARACTHAVRASGGQAPWLEADAPLSGGAGGRSDA